MNPLRLVFVEPKGGKIQDGVTVTPTKEEQTVEPDPGFDGLGAVTVEAIPDAFQDVTGVNAGVEDIRVGKVGIDAQGNLLNGEMLPRKPEQEKSVVPTKQAQTVSPDPGYALSAVNVAKIPNAYQDVSFVDAEAADIRVGKTGVSSTGERLDGQMLPRKPEQVKSATPTTSPQSVTPDTGYALSRVDVGAIPSEYADVSDVTATAGTVLTGSDFVDASGTLVHGACDYDADTSDADATAGQIEAGATAYVGGAKVTGTMPIRKTDVEIDSLSPVPIPAGSYDGTASAKLSSAAADSVDPSIIKKGAVIFGQIGTYEGIDTLAAYLNDTLTNFDFSGDTKLMELFFYNKKALESIRMPNVTTLPGSLFRDASNLKSADFRSVATITNSGNFGGCSSLETVNLSGLVSMHSYGTFGGCTSLKRIDFPRLEAISASVNGQFRLSGVEVLDFGENILTIGGNSFRGSNEFKTLIIRANTIPSLGNIDAFGYTPFTSGGKGGTLYVPQGLISQYEQATNWSVILEYPNNQILPIEGSPYEVTS